MSLHKKSYRRNSWPRREDHLFSSFSLPDCAFLLFSTLYLLSAYISLQPPGSLVVCSTSSERRSWRRSRSLSFEQEPLRAGEPRGAHQRGQLAVCLGEELRGGAKLDDFTVAHNEDTITRNNGAQSETVVINTHRQQRDENRKPTFKKQIQAGRRKQENIGAKTKTKKGEHKTSCNRHKMQINVYNKVSTEMMLFLLWL